jgi:hypothetical protein
MADDRGRAHRPADDDNALVAELTSGPDGRIDVEDLAITERAEPGRLAMSPKVHDLHSGIYP